ncbi:hypothetical protein MKW92_042583, partial [Papaver armeniacum]
MNSARWIYDRGSVLDVFKGCFSITVTYRFGVDTITSYELVIVRSILMGNDKEELVYELVLKHGSQVEFS